MYENCLKRLAYIMLAVLFTSSGFAQSARISGRVVDGGTQKHIEYATISLTDNGSGKVVTGTISDSAGNFEIQDITYGLYRINIEFIGYRPKTIDSIRLSVAQPSLSLNSV